MSDFERARQLHKLLDEVEEGRVLDYSDMQQLRAALPELPKQKTLGELTMLVYDAWLNTSGNEWGGDTDNPDGFVEDWLSELYVQMKGLTDAEPSPVPALPAGMRLADHEDFGRVVVSPGAGIDRCHEIFYLDPGMISGTDISAVESGSLTFIDANSTHLKFLETEADYASAPNGTIVAADKVSTAWIKTSEAWHSTDGDRSVECPLLSVGTRRILRWGWGK